MSHSDNVAALQHYVARDHIWPAGWREADFYLPLDCPICGRHRLLYALRVDGSEGILVHCEKCQAASYDERTLRQTVFLNSERGYILCVQDEDDQPVPLYYGPRPDPGLAHPFFPGTSVYVGVRDWPRR